MFSLLPLLLLQVALNVTGPGLRYKAAEGDFLAAATVNMSTLVRTERLKQETAKAKNDLEAYIIKTRDELESDELLQRVRGLRGGAGGARGARMPCSAAREGYEG